MFILGYGDWSLLPQNVSQSSEKKPNKGTKCLNQNVPPKKGLLPYLLNCSLDPAGLEQEGGEEVLITPRDAVWEGLQ